MQEKFLLNNTKRNARGQFVKGENIKDLVGQRFGKLVVVGIDKEKSTRKTYWICKCDCGTLKSIRADTLSVVKSCGCIKREQDITNLSIDNYHGMTKHPVFSIWNSIINRCYSEKNSHYKDYGGRGITVCEEWHDVVNFCKWSDANGFEPDKKLSIERIDVNGNYEPANCKWIPFDEQCLNTRKTVYAEIEGRIIPLAREARKNGVSASKVWHRWKNGVKEYDKLFFKGNLLEYKG